MQQHEYTIIDAHCHIFPDKIEQKAVQSIGHFYDIPMDHRGTSENLLRQGKKIGVSRYLVCSTATRPQQVQTINDFIAQQCSLHPEFIGFGTLHPYMDNIEEEIDRIIALGLYGIKLHPDFQEFNIDDPAAFTMYAYAQDRLPFLFHTGDARYDYSNPKRLAAVLERFPRLKAIGAHFGGYSQWDKAEKYLKGQPNVYFDTSSSLFKITPEYAKELIDTLGEDKFFWGTDFPMWDHQEELRRFMALDLTQEQRRKIFSGNFLSFMRRSFPNEF